MFDLGLLALRSAGFLLAFTFGIQKIGWYIVAFYSNKPFSSIGLAPLIAKIGFPMPVILALWVTFNESVGAFLIGCGLFTRALAISAALGNDRRAVHDCAVGGGLVQGSALLGCVCHLVVYRAGRVLHRSMAARSKDKSLRSIAALSKS